MRALLMGLILSLSAAPLGAAGPIVLLPCNKGTCKQVSPDRGHAGLSGIALTLGVNYLAPSIECPKQCSIIKVGQMEVHVVGHWMDLSCKIWGGEFCGWSDDVMSPAAVRVLIERTIKESVEDGGGQD